MTKPIGVREAIIRWGPLWNVLGFSSLEVYSGQIVTGLVDTGHTGYSRLDCYDTGFGEDCVFISTHARKWKWQRRYISPHEADILSDLLLGTTLTQQETNT